MYVQCQIFYSNSTTEWRIVEKLSISFVSVIVTVMASSFGKKFQQNNREGIQIWLKIALQTMGKTRKCGKAQPKTGKMAKNICKLEKQCNLYKDAQDKGACNMENKKTKQQKTGQLEWLHKQKN